MEEGKKRLLGVVLLDDTVYHVDGHSSYMYRETQNIQTCFRE